MYKMSIVAQFDVDVIHTHTCYLHYYINASPFEWHMLLTTHVLLGVLCGQPIVTIMLCSTPIYALMPVCLNTLLVTTYILFGLTVVAARR